MYRLEHLIILPLTVIISAYLVQCTGYRVPYVNRTKVVREPHLKLPESEQNIYHEKTREFLNHIKYYLGTPYQYGGQSRQGMDCSGFVTVIYQESFDIELPHNAHQIYRKCQKIASQRLRLGDLVFFRVAKSRKIDHVGIYLAKNYFVHATVSRGVVVSELTEKYYRSRFAGAGRVIDPAINQKRIIK